MTMRESGFLRHSGNVQRAWEDLPNLLSLILFMTVTALLFRSWEFALVVTASLGFHELGHVAALAWFRLDGRIYFGLVGAWTTSSLPARARLSQFANVIIHLSGPVFSLLLAALALALQAIWQPESRHLLILANFSAQVGLLNLLPAGPITDGGKIVHRMVVSLDGERRPWAIIIPVSITVCVLVLYSLIELPRMNSHTSSAFVLGLLLIGLWMAASLFIEARSSIRHAEQSPVPRPMKTNQVNFILVLMWDMLAFFLIFIAATPFWLEPDYVKGSLQNVVDVLRLLIRIV